MKVEIWSDVACPFCYIGKRNFEAALEKFPNKNNVEVEWKSFQLDPSAKYIPGKTIYEVLAERKGWTVDYAKKANIHVTKMAEEIGLHYDMDSMKPSNTFNAHRLIQLAKKHNLQSEAEEALFSALFVEGKNLEDEKELLEIGKIIGLNEAEINKIFTTNAFTSEAKNDMDEARKIGVSGVPFFVFDRKFAVSGAQPSAVFLEAMMEAFEKAELS